MAGIWYEYLWERPFTQEYMYKCALWTILEDEWQSGPGEYVIYNKMVYWEPINDDGQVAEYFKFRMTWEAPPDEFIDDTY